MSRQLSNRRLLVVDDDLDTRDLFSTFFEMEGAVVLAVASAQEAIEALNWFKPEVLVCDLIMPLMSGWELMQFIQSHEELSQIDLPSIAVTVLEGLQYQERSKSVGFEQHLVKPIHFELLITTVFELLQQQRW